MSQTTENFSEKSTDEKMPLLEAPHEDAASASWTGDVSALGTWVEGLRLPACWKLICIGCLAIIALLVVIVNFV